MIDLEHYLAKWGLTEPHLIEETSTSHVFRVSRSGQAAVLKVLTELGRRDEAKGAIALRHFSGSGAVELLEADEVAHLLELADGPLLKSLVLGGKDNEATEVLCNTIVKLHGVDRPLPTGLPTMRENFRALFACVNAGDLSSLDARYGTTQGLDSQHSSQSSLNLSADYTIADLLTDAAETATRLLDSERDVRVLHGDLHHTNVMYSSERGWLAIDPKGLVGERTYDLANLFYNPSDMPGLVETRQRIESMAQIFSQHLSLPRERILEYAFAFGGLSVCWCIEDGLDPRRRLRIACLIGSCLVPKPQAFN